MINQFGQFIPDYPGQQYYQDPNYMRFVSQQHQQQVQQAVQQPSQQPNSRMVEVFPAASEKAAQEFPVAAGATQMIIGSDDSFIAIKAVSVTGQVSFDIYDKRPPAPPEPVLNPSDYVRKDELADLIAQVARTETPTRKSTAKKEAEE